MFDPPDDPAYDRDYIVDKAMDGCGDYYCGYCGCFEVLSGEVLRLREVIANMRGGKQHDK